MIDEGAEEYHGKLGQLCPPPPLLIAGFFLAMVEQARLVRSSLRLVRSRLRLVRSSLRLVRSIPQVAACFCLYIPGIVFIVHLWFFVQTFIDAPRMSHDDMI